MATKTLLTADDLARMPDDDSVQIELDEGELITMPPAGEEHGHVEADLLVLMSNFVRKHKLGRVYGGDTGFRLNDRTVFAPDVAFVRKARVDAIRSKSFANGAPDLAVEVFSPSDGPRQTTSKVKRYLDLGTHTVWVVYPKNQKVEVFEASGAKRTLHGNDLLEAPDLLPGFSVKVADLFD
ncbi:MAG TPA: Uma2 family endonuclease [Bryobacteraceae bacterium]|jgi:Uma2 family endonuclease